MVDCLCRATDYRQRMLRSRDLPSRLRDDDDDDDEFVNLSKALVVDHALFWEPGPIPLGFVICLPGFARRRIRHLPCHLQYPLPMRRNSTDCRWHYTQSTWRGNTSFLLKCADYSFITSDSWGVVRVYRVVVAFASTETPVLPIAGLINNSLYTYLIL
jgi:hypothetical protein